MGTDATQVPRADSPGPHLILYDGSCGLCHGFVRFVLPRDPAGRFHFAAQQGTAATPYLARFGGEHPGLSTVYLITHYTQDQGRCLVKARAAIAVLAALGWPWRLASVLRVFPNAWLDWGYDQIARNRHRVADRRDSCLMPRAEHRDRFLDHPANTTRRTSDRL